MKKEEADAAEISVSVRRLSLEQRNNRMVANAGQFRAPETPDTEAYLRAVVDDLYGDRDLVRNGEAEKVHKLLPLEEATVLRAGHVRSCGVCAIKKPCSIVQGFATAAAYHALVARIEALLLDHAECTPSRRHGCDLLYDLRALVPAPAQAETKEPR